MNVCIENEGQRSLTRNVLVWFLVISFGGKGHDDARRRFRLRAEIKPHTCEAPTGRGALSVAFSDQHEAVDAKHFHQIISRNTEEAVSLLNYLTANSISFRMLTQPRSECHSRRNVGTL